MLVCEIGLRQKVGLLLPSLDSVAIVVQQGASIYMLTCMLIGFIFSHLEFKRLLDTWTKRPSLAAYAEPASQVNFADASVNSDPVSSEQKLSRPELGDEGTQSSNSSSNIERQRAPDFHMPPCRKISSWMKHQVGPPRAIFAGDRKFYELIYMQDRSFNAKVGPLDSSTTINTVANRM